LHNGAAQTASRLEYVFGYGTLEVVLLAHAIEADGLVDGAAAPVIE